MKTFAYLILTIFTLFMALTADAQIRLIARHLGVTYTPFTPTNDPLVNYDSIFYSYSGNRGGTVDAQMADAETKVTWDTGVKAYTPEYRNLWTYDGSNRILAMTNQQNYNGTLLNLYRLLYTYNIIGNDSIKIQENWDMDSSRWIPVKRFRYTYDANDKPLMDLEENWDGGSNQYVSFVRSSSAYDGTGNLTSKTREVYNSGTWQNASRLVSEYDGNNNKTADQNEMWSTGSNKWQISDRTEYTFNGNNQLVKTTYKNGAGLNKEREYTNHYTSTGQIDTTYNYSWIGPLTILKLVANYDSADRLTGTYETTYSSIQKQWTPHLQTTYDYDGNSRRVNLSIMSWNAAMVAFKKVNEYKYYYDTFGITSIPSITKEALLTLYPVPSREHLEVQIDLPAYQYYSLSVTDISGKTLMTVANEGSGLQNHTLLLNGLTPGIYYLNFQSAQSMVSKVFVVQ